MLDRHAVQKLLEAGMRPRKVAQQIGVSRRTVERIAREAPPSDADDQAARAARGVGRPQVDSAVRSTVRALIVIRRRSEAASTVDPAAVHRLPTRIGSATRSGFVGSARISSLETAQICDM